ncbi:MAG: glutathione S-transferase [Variibacter sp.]
MAEKANLKVEDAVNETCPWSGKPIAADSLTLYKGAVVGFCNPGCRDKFEKAVGHFEQALLDKPAKTLAGS